jgi:nicotinamidase/pyrazinamidase
MPSCRDAFLIIDAQYDFCKPNGALFVPGAVEDMQRLSTLIRLQADKIDHIVVTLDNHPVNDISHPVFWEDAQGHFPAPFTQVTANEVREGKWKPRFEPEKVLGYLDALETQGLFRHFIWPEHCLMGSRGAALDDMLMEALREWTHTGRNYHVVEKGQHPLTEHFGIFQAQIPIEGAPETQFNTALVEELIAYQTVYLAGEARSHCVATSLKQVMDKAPELAAKIVVIEDAMSDVSGLGHLGAPIYEAARQQGVRFVKSTDLVL